MIGVFCRYGDLVILSVVNAPKPVISCPIFAEMRKNLRGILFTGEADV